jgi:tetratricopeptide (TPR) repeat protein
MLDAAAIWQQGFYINQVLEQLGFGEVYQFQSLLNLGAAFIQFGKLPRAEKLLLAAERKGLTMNDPDRIARSRGYLGIVQHLRRNLTSAWELYGEAITKARASGNLRAESMFLKHRADLLIGIGKVTEARTDAQASRALGDVGVFPELVAAARQSLGHIYRVQKRVEDARREYAAALAISRRIGAKRLESEVYSELSRLELELGDVETARVRAIESLRIANQYALGLRQTHALLVLGRATVQSGNQALGVAYLRHARQLAERQEYWLRRQEADEQLARLGVST